MVGGVGVKWRPDAKNSWTQESIPASENVLGNELSSWVLPFFEGRGMLVFLLQDSPYDFIAI